MARNEQDPAANTQQFRAFAGRSESPPRRTNTGLIAVAVAGVVIVFAVIAIFLV